MLDRAEGAILDLSSSTWELDEGTESRMFVEVAMVGMELKVEFVEGDFMANADSNGDIDKAGRTNLFGEGRMIGAGLGRL